MELAEGDIDELVEFWTLLAEDRELLAGKRGASALGFALLLRHYSRRPIPPRALGLFPCCGRFVARQVGVDVSDLGFYEWFGRTIEYHRSQIQAHLGFRVATISDQEKSTAWLAGSIARAERRPERVRDASCWRSSGRSGPSHRRPVGCCAWCGPRCGQPNRVGHCGPQVGSSSRSQRRVVIEPETEADRAAVGVLLRTAFDRQPTVADMVAAIATATAPNRG